MEMVDIYDGHTQTERHAFGETGADKQRAYEAGAAGEGYGGELFLVYSGATQGGVDYGDNVLLMGARGELGHNAAVLFVYGLACYDITQEYAVAYNGCGGVVARRFDTEDRY